MKRRVGRRRLFFYVHDHFSDCLVVQLLFDKRQVVAYFAFLRNHNYDQGVHVNLFDVVTQIYYIRRTVIRMKTVMVIDAHDNMNTFNRIFDIEKFVIYVTQCIVQQLFVIHERNGIL